MSKRYTNIDGRAYEIPSDITVLEYIQATGTQYIDTGFIPSDNNFTWEVNRTISDSGASWEGTIEDASTGVIRFGAANNALWSQRIAPGGLSITYDSDFHTFKSDSTGLYLDDSFQATTGTLSTITKSILLFAQHDARQTEEPYISAYCAGKLRYSRIWNGTTLVQALIPAKNSSGTIGMYDLVTKAFFTNAGSGVFTVGPEVHILPDEYTELEYLQSTGAQYINTGIDASNFPIDIDMTFAVTGAQAYGSVISNQNGGSEAYIVRYESATGHLKWYVRSASYDLGECTLNQDYHMIIHYESGASYLTLDGTTTTDTTTWSSGFSSTFAINSGVGSSGGNLGKNIVYNCTIAIASSDARNYIPAKRISDSVFGLYDTVTKTFYVNAGGGTFTAGPEISGISIYKTLNIDNESIIHKQLPAEYDELEYLESTGTQYIDTGITNVVNSTFELDVQQTQLLTGYPTALGAISSSGNKILLNYNANGCFYTACGNQNVVSIEQDLNRHQFKIVNTSNSTTVSVDDETFIGEATITTDTTKSIYLYARNDVSQVNSYAKQKVFSLKITDNSTLVRNFIPAKRKSDSVLGMYDTVTETFFTNAGSGVFTAGPVVSVPSGYTQLEYIQSDNSAEIQIPDVTLAYPFIIDANFEEPSAYLGGTFLYRSVKDDYRFDLYNLTATSNACRVFNSGASGTINVVRNTKVNFHIDATNNTTYTAFYNGSSVVASTSSGTFASTFRIGLGYKVYSFYMEFPTITVNLIPVRRNSDSVLGMYDTVNDVFYTNSGTGDFIAGPAAIPVKHVNKMCVLYHPSADITGLTTQTGTPTPTAPIYPTSVEPYTLNGIDTYLDKYYANNSANLCDGHVLPSSIYGTTVTVHDDGSFTMSGTRTSGQTDLYTGEATQKSILLSVIGGSYTIESGTNGLRLYNGSTYVTDLTINGTQSYTGIFTDAKLIMNGGTVCTDLHLGVTIVEGSTIPTEYIPYVTAKHILRNIGVKVLDGTETGWLYYSDMSCAYIPMANLFTDVDTSKAQTDLECLNSHFIRRTSPTTSSAGWYLFNSGYWSSASKRFAISVEGLSSKDDYTAWLAAQYAAGTPVTVWYPLATATTEEASLIAKYLTNVVIVNKE